MLEPTAKIVQEDTFMAKVDKVVAALSVSRILPGYANMNTFGLARNQY